MSTVLPHPPPGRHLARRPRRGLFIGLAAAAALIWLVVAGIGGPLVGRLGEVAKNDNASFLPSNSESTKVNDASVKFSQQEAFPVFVIVERDSGVTSADLDAVGKWADSIADEPVPGSDGKRIKDFLISDPTIATRDPRTGQPTTSEDKKATQVLLLLDSAKSGETLPDGESVIQAVVKTTRGNLDSTLRADGLTVAVGGPGGITADLVNAFAGIDGRLLQVTLGVVFVILLLVYRSPVLPFVALLTAIFALSLAGLVIYPLAKNDIIDLNGQSQGILSILAIGAATDYALLLISRYREELHRHERSFDALRVAWRASFAPILASGSTVALGLLCLLLSQLGSNRGLGPIGAMGVVASMLSALTFLPVMLLAGRWLFWPRRPRFDLEGQDEHLTVEQEMSLHPGWAKVARFVGNRPRTVAAGSFLVLAALAAFFPSFKADGTTQVEAFQNREESVIAAELLQKHFDTVEGTPTVVVAPEATWNKARTTMLENSDVARVSPTTSGPPGEPGAKPLVKDGQVQLNAILDVPADSRAAEAVVQDLRTRLDPVSKDALVGGTAAINLDVKDASERDLRVVIPAVLVVILLVLILLLRSIVAPVLLILANVLSFMATIGACALIFYEILGMPNSDPSVPLFAFVFLVALGVDYSIFLMTRAREESLRLGTSSGMSLALTVTGGVITSAGIVLAATFSALSTIPLLFLVQVAILVALGVLLDTFIVRSLLVPSFSHLLGRRLWAPSQLSRQPDALPESAAGPVEERVGRPGVDDAVKGDS